MTRLRAMASLLTAASVSLGGCTSAGDAASGRPTYQAMWQALIGQRVKQVMLWATPSHVASPSLCFAPTENGEYRVAEVGTDFVALLGADGKWLVPLAVVQLRL